ncbi:MAG TPA: hypothetical protein VG962_10220 [Steroidobacteraceae bacterium]|nr:hypothetical protein [Steroidobacteraceae bacterium]
MELRPPPVYFEVRAANFVLLSPWFFFNSEEEPQMDNVREEYQVETGDDFLPFAYRGDRDDFAGFRIDQGQITGDVITVHIAWSRKREPSDFDTRKVSPSLIHWIRDVAMGDAVSKYEYNKR